MKCVRLQPGGAKREINCDEVISFLHEFITMNVERC